MNLKRYFYKIGYPVVRVYWFWFRPKTHGVKCVVESAGKLLMIRNTYTRTDEWTFPGGGVKKGERLEGAAAREVLEETGIVVSNLVPLGDLITTHQYKEDTVHCFYGRVENVNVTKSISEVEDVKWFSRENLPAPLSPLAGRILKLIG